jgi:hypothetical protein
VSRAVSRDARGIRRDSNSTDVPPPGHRRDEVSRPSGGGNDFEKVTVNLTSRSAEALARAMAITGESKTNVINKAVKVYAFIQEQIEAGGVLYVRDPDSNEAERLRIF